MSDSVWSKSHRASYFIQLYRGCTDLVPFRFGNYVADKYNLLVKSIRACGDSVSGTSRMTSLDLYRLEMNLQVY